MATTNTRDLRTVSEAYAAETITLITDTDTAITLIGTLPGYARVAMDTETVMEATVNPMTARLRVISLAADHGPGTPVNTWVLDVRDMDRLALGAAFRAAGQGQKYNRLHVFGWNAGFDDPVTTLNLTGCTAQTFTPLLYWRDLMLHEACLRLGSVGNSWYAGLADAARKKLGIAVEGKGTVQLSYDADTDLTQEQVRYAGFDARITLDLAGVLADEVAAAELTEIVDIVDGSRPVWQGMRIYGIEFDVDDWRLFIEQSDRQAAAALNRLAEITGGGQATLFSESLTPGWNPGSDVDVKRILNEYARDAVHAYTATLQGSGGRGRDLGASDSVDKSQLSLIGGELAELISEWRKKSKIRTSFGDNIIKLVGSDGRMHPEFTQALIDTGRSSSRNPNLQAITPHAKPRMRPTFRLDEAGNKVPRVYVQGDYSQAELRVLAQLAHERVFIDAFAAGRDLHEATAESMFGVDMTALHDSDPKEYKKKRSMAKPLNFGIAYGMRAGLLAQNLTVGGTPTTRDEANALLEQWHQAMTGAAAWLHKRDAYVESLAANPPACDWDGTWRLHLLWNRIERATKDKALKAKVGGKPDMVDVVDHLWPAEAIANELNARLGRAATDQEVAAERDERIAAAEWVRSYIGSVVILADGTPFSFESRTMAGRRRLFQVSTEEWVTAMAMIAATSRKPVAIGVRDRFAAEAGVSLTEDTGRGKAPLTRAKLSKVFEDKELKLKFVSYVLQSMPDAAEYLMRAALADCIKGLGNAFRNAPIQGSVADAAELCFARLWPRLEAETSHAHVVLSVHDSVVIECDLAEAQKVRDILAEEMTAALAAFCPDVQVKSDLDIQASAAGDEVITADQVGDLLARWAADPSATSVQELYRDSTTAQAAA